VNAKLLKKLGGARNETRDGFNNEENVPGDQYKMMTLV
jgi:hypothetical protein